MISPYQALTSGKSSSSDGALDESSAEKSSVTEIDPVKVEGAVDSLTHWGAAGWAWIPAEPNRFVEIEAILDGKIIGRTIADEMRFDLLKLGKGTGRYGFKIIFDAEIVGDQIPKLRVVGAEDPYLTYSKATLGTVEGYVDSISYWGATGWAWVPTAPEQSLKIEAVLDGDVIARALADRLRSDLSEEGKGTGRYGFSLTFKGGLKCETPPVVRAIGPDGPTILLSTGAWSTAEGYVDSITRWGAIGWAWLPTAPESAARIEAIVSGKVIGRATADQMREDIVSLGRGTGRYGFTLKFDEPISEDQLPEVRVNDSGHLVLLQGPRTLAFPNSVVPALFSDTSSSHATAFGLSVEGAVDNVTRWGAMGWAWLPAAPEQSPEIEAVLEGRVIGRTVADQIRPDLMEHGKGTGHYGFVLAFNEPLTGNRIPLLRVLGPEGPTVLPGASELTPEPKVVNAPSTLADSQKGELPQVEGHIDLLTRWDAVGWAWIPTAPDRAVQIEAVLDGRVIGRAIADQMRPDLLEHGKGTGLYGYKVSFDEPIRGNGVPELRGLTAVGRLLHGANSLPPLTQAEAVVRPRGTLLTLLKEHAYFTSSGPMFEEFDPEILVSHNLNEPRQKPAIIAFYLPQFHSIPENDLFWGKGFTEWRQLPRGVSRFPSHYQPRIPRDLGFYDLNSLDAMRAQAQLANAAGIAAFAFYYYWFNRQRVLEKPLEMLMASDLEMPFLIIWANENWTRTWDGSESQILLRQDYRLEDEGALIEDLARHFADTRYFRLNERPLFIIYNPKNIPDAAVTIARWRQTLLDRFDLNPLVFMAQTFGERDPRPYGLDGAIEFPPHKLSDKLPGRPTPDAYSTDFAGRVISYEDFINASLTEDEVEFPLIKTIVPSWDNDARRPNRGLTLEGLSPQKYEAWLHELILRAIDKPVFGTSVVAVNAWNEWAESAYLEPDVHFGSAFLNATARAYVSSITKAHLGRQRTTAVVAKRSAVSVILPNYNHARFLPERISSVVGQSLPPEEIIFLDDCSSDDSIEIARELLSACGISFRIVANVENSGCVFRQWIKGISLARNDLIWIAETDDSADPEFLRNVVGEFSREDVMASFGRITCIDEVGAPRSDLDSYYNGLRDFTWNASGVVPAFRAFSHDFSIKNVIPNASGLVFRKPQLTDREIGRLCTYRFAGDWYFYGLLGRGGAIAYARKARSFFRINQSSTSRSAFFTERHLAEHKMVIEDLRDQYGISDNIIEAHANALVAHFPKRPQAEIVALLKPTVTERHIAPIRICIAANSFEVGGGEVLPLELANELKGRGHHITYLVVERSSGGEIRSRLRTDIPVVYWDDVCQRFDDFLTGYGIEVINSHNVSFDYRMFLCQIIPRIPYVASLHGGYETVVNLLQPDFVNFLNNNVTRWLSLAEKNKKVLLDNGVSTNVFENSFNAVPEYRGQSIDRTEFRVANSIPLDSFVLVLCSRAIEEKGWRVAIEVVLELAQQQGCNVHLVLIGDGPIATEMKEDYGKSEFITFLGHVDHPIRYFPCFDLGIFPSTFSGETFPLFLLECFQAGLPVVATDIGEIPRIMGADGDFCPGKTVSHRGNSIGIRRDMVRIVQPLISDQRAYSAMAIQARETSNRFSMTALGDRYENLFYDLMNARL